MAIPTVVLLGDSILDNAAYTDPEPDTTGHLTRLLGSGWETRKLAQDGATMEDVRFQLGELDLDADVAILSMGGNDVTSHIGLLDRRASTSSDVFEELLAIADSFGREYEAIAREAMARCRRLVLCTIYEAPLEPQTHAQLVKAPLAVLNDRIIRIAAMLGADVLDLRAVCTEPEDFVLMIEPSARGAEKIAKAVAAVTRDEGAKFGRVFCG